MGRPALSKIVHFSGSKIKMHRLTSFFLLADEFRSENGHETKDFPLVREH